MNCNLHLAENSSNINTSYTVGVCVGVVITLVIVISVSYLFKHRPAFLDVNIGSDSSTVTIHQDGLDEDSLSAYSKFTTIQLELCKGGSTASGCCICLEDYRGTDLLRLLPDCGHVFHLKCVDSWL